ncbi:MAG TPA: hypothetical protein VHB97_17410 [Polyangia bacterium]|nr:hypothetical protein [Polyangia bacterium]
MGRFVVMLAVALAACSSAPKGDGDGGGGNGGAVDMLASGPPDLTPRPTAGIACGASACTTTLELCCTADNGASGACQKVQNPMCGSSEFLCDGPEDCEPANPECCVQGGYAACRPSGYCAMNSGTFMCHTTADCTPFVATAICHAANASPYAICF